MIDSVLISNSHSWCISSHSPPPPPPPPYSFSSLLPAVPSSSLTPPFCHTFLLLPIPPSCCTSYLQIQSGEHHHLSHRAKTEPLDNKVLRAFGKTVSERCRVMNGKEAVALLLGSVRVKQVRGVWVWGVQTCVGGGWK